MLQALNIHLFRVIPCDVLTFRTIISEGAFPHQILKGPQDPTAQEINNTLLVTGSLIWDPKLPGLNFDSMAKQLFHHYTSAATSNDLFHSFGPVRTLLWVQNDDFSPMIAESIAGMQKANRYLEIIANTIVVVHAAHTNRKAGKASHAREPQYEIESMIKAIQSGRRNGIKVPLHRQDHIYGIAKDLEKVSEKTGIIRSFPMQDYLHSKGLAGESTTGLPQEAFVDHYEHERRLRKEYPELEWEQAIFSSTEKSPRWKLTDHPAKKGVTQLFRKRSSVANILRIKEDIEATADIGEELYLLECKILETPDGQNKASLMEELEKLEKSWQFGVDNTAINYGSALLTEMDDRLALRSPTISTFTMGS